MVDIAIIIDVLTRVNERQTQRETQKLADSLEAGGTASGERWGAGFAQGVINASPKVQRAFSNLEAASIRVTQAQREFDKTLSTPHTEAHIRATERLTIARNAEANASRNAAAALREGTSEVDRATSRMSGMAQSIEKNVAGLTSLGRVGMPVLIGLTAALYETAQVAVTASQAVALLPAVAAAAGAGIGTLQLATAGFGQAIKDIRDLKKFNEDLYALAPNAQSAVLSLRGLIPLFDQIQQKAQENFFAGFDRNFENLAATFGPGVEKLVGSISTTFNQAISGVADLLMTPQNQSNIATTMDNISAAFQNAAPAATAFAQAFIDITTAGSDFLPGLGESIATVAQEFSTFIRNARESGKLKEWIQQGIDAARELGGAVMDIGKFIYEVFGGADKSEVQAWRNSIKNALDVIQPILEAINFAMKLFNTQIGDTGKSLSGLINPLSMIKDLVDGIRWFFDPNYEFRPGDRALSHAQDKLNEARAQRGLPPVDVSGKPLFDQGPGNPFAPLPSDQDASGNRRLLPPSRSGILGRGTAPLILPSDAPGWHGGGGLFYDPTASLPKDKKLSDSDRRDAIIAGLDPSLWKVDPYAGLPPGAAPGPMTPYGGMGYGADPQSVLEAQRKVLSQAHDLEEARKKRLALERDNTATQHEIDEAKWAEVEQGWQLQSAQADLIKAQKGKTKDLTDGFDQLGVALDKDLGISKGLPGLAENLVRFLGNLIAMPKLMELQAISNMPGQAQGGYGLIGMLGAQGAFGPQYTAAGQAAAANGGGAPGGLNWDALAQLEAGGNWANKSNPKYMGGLQFDQPTWDAYKPMGAPNNAADATKDQQIAAAQNAINSGRTPQSLWPQNYSALYTPGATGGLPTGAYPGDAALLSMVPKGIGRYDSTTKDLSQGLVDCASGVEDLVNILDGRSTAGGSLWTGNAASVLPQLGFQRGMGGPGDFRIGYNSGHMQATLPGGTNVNFGSTSAIQAGGLDGGSGAYDPSLTDHWFRPAGAGPGAMTPGSTTPFAGSSIPIPLPVTIVGGGAPPGPTPPGAGAPSGGTPGQRPGGAPGPTPPGPLSPSEVTNPALTNPPAPKAPTSTKPWFPQGGGTPPARGITPPPASGVPSSDFDIKNPPPLPPGAAAWHLNRNGQWEPVDHQGNPISAPRGGQGFPLPLSPINPFGEPAPGPGNNTFDPNLLLGGTAPGQAVGTPLFNFGPSAGAGPGYVPPPITPGFTPAIPGAGPVGPVPGQVGPFPVPGSVAATQGGLGSSALTPLTQPGAPGGPSGQSGWAPAGSGPTQIGGVGPPQASPGGGGIGIMPGSFLDTAISTAAGGLDLLAPGAGQAAQTGIKLANRAIQYAGQLAAIGVSGLMETFLPTGGSELANNSWLTRIAGGLSGAAPALPNIAGGKQGKDGQPPGPLSPEDAAKYAQSVSGNKSGQPNQVNVQYDVHGQTEDQNGKALAWHLGQAALPAGVP